MGGNSFLSITEACALLQISRPTLNKLRKDGHLTTVYAGLRPKFHRDEVQRLVGKLKGLSAKNEKERIRFDVFHNFTAFDLEGRKNVFDLRRIEHLDPYGVLTLFSTFANLAQDGQTVHLEIEDNFVCNLLRSIGFFVELEKLHPKRISWNKNALKSNFSDLSYPIPLTEVRLQKQEAPFVEKLVKLLREQGFSENIGPYIGWIIGELADNAMTHLVHANFPASCFILAQRFRFVKSKSECIIIGVADLGPGIHATLKTNPKYKVLSDEKAFLTAFKPKVSSWDDKYERGKGLTDILGIAMGNQSVFRAESGQFRFSADFRNGTKDFKVLPVAVSGTRFALVLIDHEFSIKSRQDITAYIDDALGAI